MEKVVMKKMRFSTFVKLVTYISFALGVAFGIFCFIVGIFGGPVTASFGETVYKGFTAGVMILFFGPFIFLLIGLIGAIIGFLPFKIFMSLIKQTDLYGEFEA